MFRSQSLTPFALSLVLHAGVLLLVLVGISRDEPLPALTIDLRDPVAPGAASVATAPREERPAPSSREVVEARPSAPPAPVTTAEPNSRAGGGSTVASPGSGSAAAVDRGTPAAASDHGATGRGESGGSSAARVAVAPSSGAGSGAGAEYGPYLTALRERIQQSVRYPASA